MRPADSAWAEPLGTFALIALAWLVGGVWHVVQFRRQRRATRRSVILPEVRVPADWAAPVASLTPQPPGRPVRRNDLPCSCQTIVEAQRRAGA